MGLHECEGLGRCMHHPRWHVWRNMLLASRWVATAPVMATGVLRNKSFSTQAEAIRYAQQQAAQEEAQ